MSFLTCTSSQLGYQRCGDILVFLINVSIINNDDCVNFSARSIFASGGIYLKGHQLSTYAKFCEKLTFLTP